MGKLSPSFRSAISTTILNKPPQPLAAAPPLLSGEPRSLSKKLPPKPSRKIQSAQSSGPLEKPKTATLFKSSSLADAKKLYSSFIATTRAPLDLRFYNSLLQSYASIATLNDSISFLRYMSKVQPSFSPDRSTFHVLLSTSGNGSGSSLASVQQILNFMVSNGFNPDKVTTDIAVRSLCSAGLIDEAVELVKELSRKQSPPDSFTYNHLVKQLCKSRALSTVYGFIDEMRSSFGSKPDLVTYTILIDNVCNGKNLREATRLISVLGEEGFKPDCFVYNTIMKGYCMLGRGSEAIGVYKKMKEEGLEPDVVTFNTLIFGLSKSGRVKEARKFLDIMAEMGHFPDAVTYTSLMNGMCREGDALGALSLLEVMEAKGCSPNSCTYNTLLHGLAKSRLLDRGIELYGLMKSGGMKLETASYATLVRALCRSDRIAEAYEVFDYAVESKSMTDVAAYSTLESTLKSLKKVREQGHAI
ncbi:pentatricopeptide repeat-containing protein At2g17670 [Momordica charantia]|uniref:Pentatricopeptide repeat-containing protein At2g17670 n=1 Tax=Momordica charantia TaxID=3673 RepID=A0A6J1BW58_MOMCH|nr:pentatricopeptide repeat-containing protein At2g17670 [Momordica charantia]